MVLALTGTVRKAFEQPKPAGSDFQTFQPELVIPMPMRISQLAFSADENYLVLSAENGGGLAVYDVEALLSGSTQSAFELPTNGQALRILLPNPTPEKAELFAVVTVDGNLMMANLKEKNFVSGPNGQVLKSGVSCISWSARGKQLVAGLGDGTTHQLTPEGAGKLDIPRPPNVNPNEHGTFFNISATLQPLTYPVSSIFWLENNVFLMVHTAASMDNGPPSESHFNIVTRDPTSGNFMFQKIIDPVGAFGIATRSTPHHFMLRLRDFPPTLKDMIIVASSASTDIGLFTRSDAPLTRDKPADKISGVFTLTEMSDDSRRAQLPPGPGLTDTSPIGMALDLSSNEKVLRPIPTDSDINESPTPLPLLTVLNNDGVLAAWWVVYNDSIRQGLMFPGLIAAPATQTQASPAPVQAVTSAFGAPAFGAPKSTNAFGAPSTANAFGSNPAFGQASSFGTPAFGATSAPGAFGTSSGLGQKQSVWGTTTSSSPAQTSGATFGSSTFGSAPAAPAFGSSAMPGNRASPWAAAGGPTTAPAFGQATTFGKPSQPFGSSTPNAGTTPSSSGGFASFATKGGFAAAASGSGGSLFGSQPTTNAFGTPAPSTTSVFGTPAPGTASVFGSQNKTETPFGSQVKTESPFGAKTEAPFGSNGFILGSTFKADPSAKDDGPAPSNESKGSFMGGNFLGTINDTAKSPVPDVTVSKETDMDTGDDIKPTPPSAFSTTPASTPAAPKFSFVNDTKPTPGSLFGTSSTPAQPVNKPAAGSLFGTSSTPVQPVNKSNASFGFGQPVPNKPKPSGLSFGNILNESPSSTPITPISTGSQLPVSPKIKSEPQSDGPLFGKIPSAPLPPDATSKDPYAAGDTSSSSVGDAPLPPDFMPKRPVATVTQPLPGSPVKESVPKPVTADMIPPQNVPGGPSSDGGSSEGLTDEGSFGSESGDEQTGEPSEEGSGEDVANDLSPTSDTRQTPAITPETSFGRQTAPTPDTFAKIQAPAPSKSLFGEIKGPVLLPPTRIMASPRSPSPVRSALLGRLRPESSRSVSAPGNGSQMNKPGSSTSISQRTPLVSQPDPRAEEKRRAEFKAHKEAEEKRRAELKAQKEAEEEMRLVDDADENIQQILESDLEATKDLKEFLAHTDYVSDLTSESIPHQVETVFRDINSMIDTLGLNARSMQNFIKYQTEQYKEAGRTREDLEDDDDWCLVEIEALSSVITNDLTKQLQEGRVTDFAHKLQICKDLQKEVHKLRAKHEDIKKIIDSHLDGSQDEISRSQPLAAEQAAQQHDLRKEYMQFQTLLAKSEEALTTLKASVVSRSAASGISKGSSGPTVEAVMRTIAKMTSMAEKRSGDIDVLEGQMRKLRFGSTMSVGSREGSPFVTPQKFRASTHMGTSSTSRFYTPDSTKDPRKSFRNSFMSSVGSQAFVSSPRKKISGFTADEKAQVKAKMVRRKEVTNRLKFALEKNGTNVRLMNDE